MSLATGWMPFSLAEVLVLAGVLGIVLGAAYVLVRGRGGGDGPRPAVRGAAAVACPRRGGRRRPRLRRALGLQLRPRARAALLRYDLAPAPAGRPGRAERATLLDAGRPRFARACPRTGRAPFGSRRPRGARSRARRARLRGRAGRSPSSRPAPVRAAQARPLLAPHVVPGHRRHLHPVHVRGQRERHPARLGDPVHRRPRAGAPARASRARTRRTMSAISPAARIPIGDFQYSGDVPRRALRAGRAGAAWTARPTAGCAAA